MRSVTRDGKSHSSTGRGISSLADFVRQRDRDRYQTALFAPPERREMLFVLYAFNYEVARIRESVTEPMLGQIRLQWWREVVDAAYTGAPVRQHEVAAPLTALIREVRPDRAHFARIIDTRERDLAGAPPADLAALEDYARGTSSSLLYLALDALDAAETLTLAAAREIGIGYGLAGLLRAVPFHAAAGRSYIPADIARRAGLDPQDQAQWHANPGLRSAVAEIGEAAALHLRAARSNRIAQFPRARAALLPAVVADQALIRLRRVGYDPYAPELRSTDALQSWRLFAAALRGRI